jgi:hypothetical protein
VPYISKEYINDDVKQVFPESKDFCKLFEKIDKVVNTGSKERFTLKCNFKENIHY